MHVSMLASTSWALNTWTHAVVQRPKPAASVQVARSQGTGAGGGRAGSKVQSSTQAKEPSIMVRDVGAQGKNHTTAGLPALSSGVYYRARARPSHTAHIVYSGAQRGSGCRHSASVGLNVCTSAQSEDLPLWYVAPMP